MFSCIHPVYLKVSVLFLIFFKEVKHSFWQFIAYVPQQSKHLLFRKNHPLRTNCLVGKIFYMKINLTLVLGVESNRVITALLSIMPFRTTECECECGNVGLSPWRANLLLSFLHPSIRQQPEQMPRPPSRGVGSLLDLPLLLAGILQWRTT